jgi:hypothetical protein
MKSVLIVSILTLLRLGIPFTLLLLIGEVVEQHKKHLIQTPGA